MGQLGSLLLQYPFASSLAGSKLRLATTGVRDEAAQAPYFFEADLPRPGPLVDMLLMLSTVAQSRFYLPAAARNLDPVVTLNRGVLRFEAFSSCCGVYARVDVRGEAVRAGFRRGGTTNVDFNPKMRQALASLRHQSSVTLSVGQQEVAIASPTTRAVEKKVPLNRRWLRGFCEVQAYQRALVPMASLPGGEVLRFVQKLSPKQPQRLGSLVTEGPLRLVYPMRPGTAVIGGAGRLKALLGFVTPKHEVTLWSDAGSGVSGWELCFGELSAWLLLSPELARGFSGEGQLLATLAEPAWRGVLALVEAELCWQSGIDVRALARKLGAKAASIEAALAALATRGLVGFDARAGLYFHRELPFDPKQIDLLQPRLRAARQLVNGLEQLSPDEFLVPGSDLRHHVRRSAKGDRCSCLWFAKHRGERGPCRHILATYLLEAQR